MAGGASGLGEAASRALSERGATVTIADLNAEKGEALAEEIGGSFVETNVTDEAAVQAAVDQAAEADGGLRISVCCAGIGWAQRVTGKQGPHPLDLFTNVITVNLIGTFNVLRLASTAMNTLEPLETGERGICINTASIAGYEGQIGQIAYASSKAGVIGLTLPAARDLASRGIRVLTIAPGTFDTPMLAMLPQDARDSLGAAIPFPSRLGKPSEYAELAVHMVENQMLNGETVRLDGALRMPPR